MACHQHSEKNLCVSICCVHILLEDQKMNIHVNSVNNNVQNVITQQSDKNAKNVNVTKHSRDKSLVHAHNVCFKILV
jgi:hypothetical protein